MDNLRNELLEVINQLSPRQQKEVLGFARQLQRPKGVPAQSLLKFVGSISPEDLERMQEAIKDCEVVNLDEW